MTTAWHPWADQWEVWKLKTFLWRWIREKVLSFERCHHFQNLIALMKLSITSVKDVRRQPSPEMLTDHAVKRRKESDHTVRVSWSSDQTSKHSRSTVTSTEWLWEEGCMIYGMEIVSEENTTEATEREAQYSPEKGIWRIFDLINAFLLFRCKESSRFWLPLQHTLRQRSLLCLFYSGQLCFFLSNLHANMWWLNQFRLNLISI